MLGKWVVDTTQLYIRCRVGHIYRCVKFKLNDISLYMTKDTNGSEPKQPINRYNQVYFMICIFDIIAVKFIYFTLN